MEEEPLLVDPESGPVAAKLASRDQEENGLQRPLQRTQKGWVFQLTICTVSIIAGVLFVFFAVKTRGSDDGINVNFESVLGFSTTNQEVSKAKDDTTTTKVASRPTVNPTRNPSSTLSSVSSTISTVSSSGAMGSSKDKVILNDKPNVIFVLADDMGYNSIGDQDLDLDFTTPFLSKLARKSVTMSNYYTQETCTPARAALLTGRYPLTLGMQLTSINAYATNALNKDETLLGEILQDAGYTTYHIGKWNLGHYHPRYLPTSRGFDYFLGYMDGQTYYWSKKNPRLSQFTDLIYGNKSCYSGYDGVDRHDYSTFLFRDKAINVIESHDYENSPLFLYLALQAVHDPFYDFDNFESGIPKSYLDAEMYNTIISEVSGRKRRQYAMALALMDQAVESVYDSLDSIGQMENSYVIFTSDNGGCYGGGGKNGAYRGGKGSLYEGGTKVDAFIYSPLFSDSVRGFKYKGLMHVTDWVPTIADLAQAEYEPTEGFELDGVSHWGYLNRELDDGSYPRNYLLYNYIVDVGGKDFSIASNAPVAVRNQDGIKLIHSYVGNPSTEYYSYDGVLDDDSSMTLRWECTQSDSMSGGKYRTMLFDLANDPYETTDLFDDAAYSSVKAELYAQIDVAYAGHASCSGDGSAKSNKEQRLVWKEAGDYIIPWAEVEDEQRVKNGYPAYCISKDHALAPIYEKPTAKPTNKPSIEPTRKPTKKTSKQPTMDPTKKAKSPTSASTYEPTLEPTSDPTEFSSGVPSFEPTHEPTNEVPTQRLTAPPTLTRMLTNAPSFSSAPNSEPSNEPSDEPSKEPSSEPSSEPWRESSSEPSSEPTITSPPSPSSMHTSPPSPSAMPTTTGPTTRFDFFLSQEESSSSFLKKKESSSLKNGHDKH